MRAIGSEELDKTDNLNAQQSLFEEDGEKDYDIASYILGCWEQAKKYKENGAETQILKNMRQIDGQYESDKLRAIKEIGGSELFMMITDAKCKNAANWVSDILFQKPWSILTTPVPDLPDELKAEIYGQLVTELLQTLAQTNPEILSDPQAIAQISEQMMPEIEKQAAVEMMNEAKKRAYEIEKRVDDKLVEGGWYKALKDATDNVILHTGILKGPILKKRNVTKAKTDKQTGKITNITEEQVIPTFESRHPLFIYPAPGSTAVDDGYLIDRIKITPMKLQELIGVEGYKEDEILAVLSECANGKYNNWLNLQVDQDIADLNDELHPLAYDSDKIDCLEFWGYVYGDKLIEWGKIKDKDDKEIDENKFYNICAYLIGRHVIKIQFNKDPMGRKPYYKSSFEEKEGSFWGKGLPEIILDCQTACNSVARAIANNAAMGSGPQVERNIDRIPPEQRANNRLIPWMIHDVTDSMMMSTSPALKFYQPPMVVDKLMTVYQSFSKIADEHSGVPAYAHGDSQVGGAGNTSSGLSMLMSAAARGIKALVMAIDNNIISESVKRQYQYCIEQEENYGLICDYEITTTGSVASLAKEQLAARRMEFMTATNNPVDLEIIGKEGRKYLLEETARSMQLDVERIFPPQLLNQGVQQGIPINQGNPGPAEGSQTIDNAGNPVQGQDMREGSGPIQTPAGLPGRATGGPVEGGQPYVVGEQGPEIVVPDQSGTVIPNSQTYATFGSPSNLYDMNSAQSAGLKMNSTSHWPSRIPTGEREGLILKHEKHPTFWMTVQEEMNKGYNIYRNQQDGRLYSFPKDWKVPSGFDMTHKVPEETK